MAIGKIKKASRYIVRYREIFSVLYKYGLADWANRIGIEFAKEFISRQSVQELLELSTEERVRLAMVELGPTFIKFGQILSVRPDLVGVPLSNELKKLQSNVKPDAFENIKETLENELGQPIDEVFEKIETTPVASASIGQVHKAWLKTGENVAVKVQHKDIKQTIETDIDILKDLAGLLEDFVEDSRYYRPKETVEQFARTISRELDFNREARHIALIWEDFSEDTRVKIPQVFEDLTTSKTLVMEWIDGIPVNRLGKLKKKPPTEDIARNGAEIFLTMIFVNGFYHADPHPGNLMVCESDRIGLLDFGMVGRLSAPMRENVEDMVSAVMSKDSEKLARVIVRAGSVPREIDMTALGADVTDFIQFYGSLPINKIKLFEALNEMVTIIHRHHIVLPTEIMMLIKTMVTLEGSARALSPDFDLLSLLGPYQSQMGQLGFAVARRLSRVNRLVEELQQFAETMPEALSDIVERFRKGSLEIHLEHRGLEHSVNRLVFGVITAALFLGSSLLLSFKAPPLLYDFSILGLIGIIVSIVMGIRILWAIMISGRLD